MIHTVKGFTIFNEAEIDVFLELSGFFDDAADVGNMISGSSAFSKTFFKKINGNLQNKVKIVSHNYNVRNQRDNNYTGLNL